MWFPILNSFCNLLRFVFSFFLFFSPLFKHSASVRLRVTADTLGLELAITFLALSSNLAYSLRLIFSYRKHRKLPLTQLVSVTKPLTYTDW